MKQISTTLTQVIFEIFGDMFFMFPEHYDSGQEVVFPADWIKYRLKITGDDTGGRVPLFYLNCYFTPPQAEVMAENFLGEDAGEISPVIVGETLKEAVNVLGGNLLNRLEHDYHIGIPEPCTTENQGQLKEFYNRNPDVSILLNVENQPFLALLTQS